MPQSLSNILLHVVFSTKNRERTIKPDVRPQLHAYLAGICRDLGSEAYRVGGTDDHVHIACTLPRTLTVSVLLQEVKKTSSAWMKEQGRDYFDFAWQSGYGVFSLGASQLKNVKRYIENQEEHHKKRSFEEEFRELLNKYEVPFDERYVWD